LIRGITEKLGEKIAYWSPEINPPYARKYAHFPHDRDGNIEQSLLTFAGLEVSRRLPSESLPTSDMKDERMSIRDCGMFRHDFSFSVREKKQSSLSGGASSFPVVDGKAEKEKALGQQHRQWIGRGLYPQSQQSQPLTGQGFAFLAQMFAHREPTDPTLRSRSDSRQQSSAHEATLNCWDQA
jgi:hypothetical protein